MEYQSSHLNTFFLLSISRTLWIEKRSMRSKLSNTFVRIVALKQQNIVSVLMGNIVPPVFGIIFYLIGLSFIVLVDKIRNYKVFFLINPIEICHI